MKIIRLGLLEYYIAFAGNHSALSNRYAAQADAGGSIYGAKIDGTYAGFLCVSDEITAVRITYALTVPEYRKQGVFTELVKHVIETHKKIVRAGISKEHPCYSFILKTFLKLGFLPGEKVTVFSCSRKDEDKWRRFMDQKGKRLCETLKRQGYRAVSFGELSEDLLTQLKLSDRSEYANIFHPSMYLENPANRLSRELSFAAVKDGKLSAYCLVTMGDERSAMFDQISVTAGELGMGVILLPYVFSMERFFEMGLENAYYAMYGSNERANAFRNKILAIFPTTETTMENYCFLQPHGQESYAAYCIDRKDT